MDTLFQDIRFGLRQLRRTPGFTVAAVLALALGIGATTAIFSVLDRVVLRPLPYPDADRLTMVWEANDGKGLSHERISPVNFGDYRGLTQVFDDGAAWWYPQLTLTETGHEPLRVNAIETTANFFSVLGVQPVVGAGFPKTPFYARETIAIISHRLWRERFGGDPAIVGKTVALNGPLFTVVGVMAPGFQYPNDTDVWQRITWDVAQHSRGAHFMESIFRLKPGMTTDAANAELRGADQAPSVRRTHRPTASTPRAPSRSRPKLSAFSGRRCSRSSARRRSCWSSPAPTSRACCWRVPPCASGRWRCAPRSAPAAAA